MKTMPFLAAILLSCLFMGCAAPRPLTTVEQVDLKRYAGRWHEVARYPNWFQRDCAKNVTAEYTAQRDGTVRVVNSCETEGGKAKSITGVAKVVPGSNNARLRVSFFRPFQGDYWIIGLDREYRWALVGHPSRKYLWILSRDRKMSEKTYAEVVRIAVRKGYSADKIVRDQ